MQLDLTDLLYCGGAALALTGCWRLSPSMGLLGTGIAMMLMAVWIGRATAARRRLRQ